jgi:hypothetical protein
VTGLAHLPSPPVPADADLTHYDEMPLEVRRLRDSGIAGVGDAELFRCAVLLWCVAWHQVPAGSLPDDDVELCRLVGLGRDLRTWKRIRAGVLRGWRLFADGRLYHRVVAEKVIKGWNSTLLTRWGRECDRIRKENKAREKQQPKLDPLEFPPRPAELAFGWPAETASNSAGKSSVSAGRPPPIPPEIEVFPPEKALNRREGKGREGNQEDSAASDSASPREGGGTTPEEAALEHWNAIAAIEGWPAGQMMTSTRRFRMQVILALCGGIEGWKTSVETARDAAFLRSAEGTPVGWFDFDWLLDEQHFARLTEGRYAEKHERSRPASPASSSEALYSGAMALQGKQPLKGILDQ